VKFAVNVLSGYYDCDAAYNAADEGDLKKARRSLLISVQKKGPQTLS